MTLLISLFSYLSVVAMSSHGASSSHSTTNLASVSIDSSSSQSPPSHPPPSQSKAYSALLSTYHVILYHWPEIILVIFVASYWSSAYYATFIWMAYYTSDLMPGGGLEHHPWIVNIVMLVVLVLLLPFGGMIGDVLAAKWKANLFGYRLGLAIGCWITILFGEFLFFYFLDRELGVIGFYLINMRHVWSVCLGQGVFALSLALYGSIMAVVMVNQV